MGHLRQHFNLLDDDSGDYSIEIDPREADWSTMGLLRELGFNRVSLGVQDLDPPCSESREPPANPGRNPRHYRSCARTLQFRSVNIDLIYGLPLQTPERFARTVDEIIALQPDRLSFSTTPTCRSALCRSGASTPATRPAQATNWPCVAGQHRATERRRLPLYRHGSLRAYR